MRSDGVKELEVNSLNQSDVQVICEDKIIIESTYI